MLLSDGKLDRIRMEIKGYNQNNQQIPMNQAFLGKDLPEHLQNTRLVTHLPGYNKHTRRQIGESQWLPHMAIAA